MIEVSNFMPPVPDKKVVILCSGGMNSVTPPYAAAKDYSAMASLSFHYGSKHNDREISFERCLSGKMEL